MSDHVHMVVARRSLVVALALGAPLVAGCYLAHEHEHERDREPLPGLPDRAPPIDAGSPMRVDAGAISRDAGSWIFPDASALPDDEPDVDPGERPSDDLDAGEWLDPPPPDGSPCCDVSEPIPLDDIHRQASPPVVAWDGSAWGVAWSDTDAPATGIGYRAIFRRIDGEARPLSEMRVVPRLDTHVGGLAFGNHRFALTTSRYGGFRDERPGWLAVLDRDGVARDAVALPEGVSGRAVVRHPAVHGWAVSGHVAHPEGDGRADASLLVYDEALREVARHPLGEVHSDSPGAVLVSLKSTLVTATPSGDTTLRVFQGRDVVPDGEHDLGTLGTELAATRLRDSVVVIGRSFGRSSIQLAIWDAFERRVVVAPRSVGTASSGQGIAIAADDRGGTIAFCHPVGGSSGRDAAGIQVTLLAPDGTSLGSAPVATGYRYVASCAVAAAGLDTYVVLWWNAAWEPPGRPSILAARVRVRR